MGITARGEPISTDDPVLIELYDTAIRQFQTYAGDPIETMDKAIAHDPGFVSGHLLRAIVLFTMSERQYRADAWKSIEAAEWYDSRANERERGHIKAARNWLLGDWRAAGAVWDAVTADYPRDALAIQAGHLADFYVGDCLNLRDRIKRVLPNWDTSTPGYSYILGMHAFGLEECGNYDRAETTGLEALAIERRDGWAVHAVTHVMEMQGRFDDGRRFLEERVQDWAPDNGFAFHNWWHLALFYIESGDYGHAISLYDERVNPEPTGMSLQMLDASALLWRLTLLGIDTASRWQTLASEWLRKTPQETGYYAFNDVHAVMAVLGAGQYTEAEKIIADMEKAVAGGAYGGALKEVGIPLARALLAFSNERYGEAADILLPIRTIANRFGGSHAQRDVITQTLIESAIRSEQSGLAEKLVNERIAWKPHTPLTAHFADRWRAVNPANAVELAAATA
jgi:tetratricopeptide (TPR) repeat protein